MNTSDIVAVASRSFSKNEFLRLELLKQYKHVIFNETGKVLEGNDLVQFLQNADKAIIALEKIDASILAQLPKLKVISKYGVGLNNLEYQALNEFGIKLGWIKGVNKRSVAELALSFALILSRKISENNSLLKSGKWQQIIGNQLTKKTFGIIGLGNIGKDLACLLKVFECEILYYDVNENIYFNDVSVKAMQLEDLLRESDIVSLHIPYNNKNHNFLDKTRLALLKKNCILINTSRGNLIDEEYLLYILKENKIAAAGFDVYSSEPNIDTELLNLENFFGTPHIGGSSLEAIIEMGKAAIWGLDNYSDIHEFQKEWYV